MKSYLKHYPISFFIGCIIIYLSFFKPPQNNLEQIQGMDKIVHFCMYGGLCTIIWIEYLLQHPRLIFWKILVFGILLPIIMSGCIEILQSELTNYRSGDYWDLAANTLGILSAALGGYFIWRPLISRYKRLNKS